MSSLTTLKPAGAANSLPASFQGQKAAAIFQDQEFEHGSEGVEGGYGIIKYAGKVWSLQIKGENKPFLRQDDGTPRGAIDVVFTRTATNKAKTYYKSFVEGSKEKPICSSNDGIKPDANVIDKQSVACAICPHNVFGSRVTDDGKQAKACSDHKRAAVVLDPQLALEALGYPLSEPVLMRIPAASLQDFSNFGDTMHQQGFPLPSFVTRISFDITKTYPKLKFEAIRRLSDEEGVVAMQLRNGNNALRIIADSAPGEAALEEVTAAAAAGMSAPREEAQPTQVAAPQQETTTNVVPMNIAPRAEAIQQVIPPQQVTQPTAVPRPTPQAQAQAMADAKAGGDVDFDKLIDAKINDLIG